MKNSIKIILLIALHLIAFTSFAQIPRAPQSALSPNAQGLGEYGEVPVSPYTGIPQIEIPLYEVQTGEHSFPITLSYHAGGVRPDQHPGWVGLGWTLNAGGCISRIVKDIPDETYISFEKFPQEQSAMQGYYYKHSVLDFDWNNNNIIRDKTAIVAESALIPEAFDSEPDEFIFNFNGYSGRFFIDAKGTWRVQCDKPLVVELDSINTYTTTYSDKDSEFNKNIIDHSNLSSVARSHSFKTFNIITEDGTKYVFGNDDNAIEFGVNFFGQYSKSMMANTWNLTKIIYTDSREVNFIYEHRGLLAQFYYSYLGYRAYNQYFEYSNDANFYDGCEGQLIIPSYLSNIKFSNYIISFYGKETKELKYNYDMLNPKRPNNPSNPEIYNTFVPILQYNGQYSGDKRYPNCLDGLKWYALSNMRVINTGSTSEYKIIKEFTFEYSNNEKERLTLKSLNEFGEKSDIKKSSYKFDYFSPDSLPPYFSKQLDHWGFYNKRNPDKDNYYSSRELATNLNTKLYGTLKKITYPTGGYSRFVFESHDYDGIVAEDRSHIKYNSENHRNMAGGLRIKEIFNCPNVNDGEEILYKRYYYTPQYFFGDSIRSSGTLSRILKYQFKDFILCDTQNKNDTKLEVFSSQPLYPLSSDASGAHVSYSAVTEENPDGSFTEYYYNDYASGNYDSQCDYTIQPYFTSYVPFSSRAQERGLLNAQIDYNANKKKLKEKRITYQRSNETYLPSIKAYMFSFYKGYYYFFKEATAYRHHLYTLRKSYEKEYTYSLEFTKPSEVITSYGYNKHNIINKITITPNNYTKKIIDFDYPGDISNSISSSMEAKNILNRWLSKRTSSTIYDNNYLIESIYLRYIRNNDDYVVGLVEKSKGNYPSDTIATYKYDDKSNIIYSDIKGELPKVYIWGHRNEYLISMIENTNIPSVTNPLCVTNLNAISSPAIPDYKNIVKLSNYLPDSNVWIWYYGKAGNVTSQTDPRKKYTYYSYDYFYRPILVRDNDYNVIKLFKYNYAQ